MRLSTGLVQNRLSKLDRLNLKREAFSRLGNLLDTEFVVCARFRLEF